MSQSFWPSVGGGGSAYWGDAVANFAALPPAGAVVGEVRLVLDTDELYEWTGSAWLKVPATGVVGPALSTDNAIARFDGTTGKLLQNSGATIDDSGNLTAVGITSSALTADTVPYANASKQLTSSAVTPTELGYVSGVTSAIQTQINAKVTGPASATDNAIARFDLTTGKLIQDSTATVDDSGNISAGSLTSSFLTANTVPYADGSKVLTSSAVTPTELGYVSGVTSSIQTQLNAKEPTITVLPVAKGGTNSGTALNNNRVIQSASGAIVEAAAITASRALISDANGIPTHATTTATEIGYVNGVTSAIQTQLDGKEPTITVLSIAKGGTNSGTALNNNRVMVSSGSAVVEASAITASRALVSDSNGLPVAATTTSTEIGYVNGVTSAIQTQLDAKLCATQVISVSSDVTLTNRAIHLVDTSSARSLTLPSPSATRFIVVKDATGSATTNNITIVRAASESIETVAASYVLDYALGSWTFVSDGTNWFVI